MVKDCKVSLTLGKMGTFHFLAPGKSVRKITSGWEWRQLTCRKLKKKKIKQESGADIAECGLSKTWCNAPWPNCCCYLSNFFIQLNQEHSDLWWGMCSSSSEETSRQIPWKAWEWELCLCGDPARAPCRAHSPLKPTADPFIPSPRSHWADSPDLWPHTSPLHTSEFICSEQTEKGNSFKSICS